MPASRSTWEDKLIQKSKQQWTVGQQVKVGFLSGLTVLAVVPTPGDAAPDAYILSRGASVYTFVPHNGLTKISADEARAMVAQAAARRARAEAAAAVAAEEAVRAAQLRAELLGSEQRA